jgi:zinc transport system substrate-binding protein
MNVVSHGLRCCLIPGLLLLFPVVVTGDEVLRVYAVNYPLQYFAQRIGGEHVESVFPAPPGVDPAFWNPDVVTIGAYQGADLILLNGAGYAKWTDKATLPHLKLVDTSQAFADSLLASDGITHSHGLGGRHSHAGTAFTTWLDLSQAAAQARAVTEALSRQRPEAADLFESNYRALADELRDLDERLLRLGERKPNLPLLASHPVYQYLARRYRLRLESVHWEPDEVPDEASWKRFEGLLTSYSAGWMIWEGVPDPNTVARLEKLGVRSVVFDPCANRPGNGDFMGVMDENIRRLEEVFR